MPEDPQLLGNAIAAILASQGHVARAKALLMRVGRTLQPDPSDPLKAHWQSCLDSAIAALGAAEACIEADPLLRHHGGDR